MSETPLVDPREFRNALGRFATGITIVTATHEGQTHGMTCNAFMSVSLTPPLVVVSIAHKAKMHQWITQSGRYGVSILTVEQGSISTHFAGQPQDNITDPFITVNGMPLIANAAVHLVTEIVATHEAGDHTLFIGQVNHLSYKVDVAPLLYFGGRYGQLTE